MNYRMGSTISGALTVLFLGLIIVVGRTAGPPAAETPKMEEVQIVDENVSDVAAVAVTHGEVRFGLIHRPPEIIMEPPLEGERLSKEEMQSFLYRLSKLTALGTLRQKEELAAYGLDSPRALVTLILEDGEKIRLFLGKENPVNGSSYVAMEGAESLFLISEADAAMFTARPRDFRNRRILPKIETGDIDLIEEVSLSYESQSMRDFTVRNTSRYVFDLAEPFSYTLDYDSVLSSIIFPLMSLTPDRVLGEPESPEPPGTPGFGLELVFDGSRYELSFREGEDSYFIRREDVPRIYEISKDRVPWGDLRYLDLMSDAVYHANISGIDRLLITFDGEQYGLELSGQSTSLTGNLEGVRLEHPELMELYDALFATGITGVVTDENAVERQIAQRRPEIGVQVFRKNGTIDVVEFYRRNEMETLVALNGEVHLITYTRGVSELVRTMREITQPAE